MIETTGLADPYPVLTTLRADPVLRHHFRAGCVVTTVDSVNGLAQLRRDRLRIQGDIDALQVNIAKLKYQIERRQLRLALASP